MVTLVSLKIVLILASPETFKVSLCDFEVATMFDEVSTEVAEIT